jgi:spore coat polysaccharide biosynthesis predicted glycosyltransferase SpsG
MHMANYDCDILIRVDAGFIPNVAFGHLFRCIEIADELKNKHSLNVMFLLRNYSEAVAIIVQHGYLYRLIERDASYECQVARINEINYHVLLLDIIDAPVLLDSGGIVKSSIVVIDDLNQFPRSADIVINGSILAEKEHVLEDGECYLGPKFSVLSNVGPETDIVALSDRVKNVLLTFGGADPESLTTVVLEAILFQGIHRDIELNVVLGPANQQYNKVAALLTSFDCKCQLHVNPENMNKLFFDADLVMCAGGRTVYELASIGMPTLILPSNDNENNVAQEFSRRGMASYVDHAWRKKSRNLAVDIEAAFNTMKSRSTRESMQNACVLNVDAYGASRIANLLVECIG